MVCIPRSVCLVGCSVLLASVFLVLPAMGTDMVESQCSVQDEAALLQKEASVTIRAEEDQPQDDEYEVDENGVMQLPEIAKAARVAHLAESPDELAPGEKLPSGQNFASNMIRNDEAEAKSEAARTGKSKETYEDFINSPNRPGHVHYKPGVLFIPEKDSAKMQQAVVKASELVKKAKQVKKSVITGIEKAEEMVMVAMPSLDEVSEQIVEEDKEDKFHERGGDVRRRRISLDEALPDGIKKRLAKAPEMVMERRENQENQRQSARKIWDLQSGTGTKAAMDEVQKQAKHRINKGVKNIGQVIAKWTTTTKAPEGEAAAEADDSDKSGSTIMSLNALVFLLAMYSSS